MTAEARQVCPRCGNDCSRDSADVGVGVIYGPWGCYCGWSEDDAYDVTDGPKFDGRYVLDQWGGATPIGPESLEARTPERQDSTPLIGTSSEEPPW